MIPDLERTIAALATPAGRGALGVIRLSGSSAIQIASGVLRLASGRQLSACPERSVRRASVVDSFGERVDDVLVTLFRTPRSYTGEELVEISAHGGPVTLRRILTALYDAGAAPAQPGEFTLRAFVNGKLDLAQAEAVADLIAAETVEAGRLALRQQEGVLSRRVQAFREEILGVLARIEASIDFPEDVGELDADVCAAALTVAAAGVRAVLKTADSGILYRSGVKIVLAGRPNVGKSSLLNALLRVGRAIVTPVPGTTRDVLEETLNLRGIPVRAVDTAGIRETNDPVEEIGVARSWEAISGADLVLLVLDSTSGWTAEDRGLYERIRERPHLILWNKADLARPSEMGSDSVVVSATTGLNLDGLEDRLADLLTDGEAVTGGGEDVVVTNVRHREALKATVKALESALESLGRGMPPDFVSIDVRGALLALGEITGLTTGEDIINEIFARFCIGK